MNKIKINGISNDAGKTAPKNRKRIFSLALTFALVLGYYLTHDQELNSAVKSIRAKHNIPGPIENNGEVYRLGMRADFADDPYQVGKNIVEQARQQDGVISDDVIDAVYPAHQWLAEIPVNERTSALLCNLWDPACFDFIWQHSEQIDALYQRYQPYVERFEGLMAYDTFIPVSKPAILTRYHFSDLDLLALRIMLLRTVALVKDGQTEAAAQKLAALLRFQSQQLIIVNEAVSRAIAIAEYKFSLDTAAFLLSKTPESAVNDWQVVYNALTPFDRNTVNMTSIYEREIAIYANDLDHLLHDTHKSAGTGLFSSLYLPLFYKPNKTLNTLYAYTQLVSNQMTVENGRFVIRNIDQEKQALLGFSLNNYIGNLVIETAVPKLIHLQEAMHELNYLQRLFRLIYNAKVTDDPAQLNSIVSPYTGEEAFIKQSHLCLAGDGSLNDDICLFFE
ncbi:hypothetical protein [Alteromonas lipolytica]|uniref:Uncharacterized protein n=1 Tax=Alteromonas lipolytica TaxID=1856405 RepID=A0A1E8FBQ3_9ALTE|nr:hypothetical protein [Alteromonas lipolytica]OFI33340.1 hypothetical protein BFC17_03505 [Alteromonas lipolytica]GGF60583.1 hypothetical protein GCM10011338_11010 [Alteromonas lipolytica]